MSTTGAVTEPPPSDVERESVDTVDASGPAPRRACVAIVTYNSAGTIGEVLEALLAEQASLPHRVVVFDNASQDDTVAICRATDPAAEVIASDKNLGFGTANNRALDEAEEPFIILVNPDCVVRPGALRGTVEYLERHPGIGIVGLRSLGQGGEIQASEMHFPSPMGEFLHIFFSFGGLRSFLKASWWRLTGRGPAHPADWLLGNFMTLPRKAWEELEGFDENIFLFGEDMDICWRARKLGYEVALHPGFEVVHAGGHSTRPALGDDREKWVLKATMRVFGKHCGLKARARLLWWMERRLALKAAWLKLTWWLRGRDRTRAKLEPPLRLLQIITEHRDELARG